MDQHSIVTVFGGTGFIGRAVVAQLARTGARIRIATRIPARAYGLRVLGGVGQVVPVACDVHDDVSVRQALDGATHAVNLIGVLFESGRRNSFKALHTDVPARIARCATACGVLNLVHISALGADAQGPSAYSRSKAAGEAGLHAAFPTAVILRPSIVFGSDDNFFNQFARIARLSHTLPLIGGGRTRFQPVFVGDVAAAALTALTDPRHRGKTFALGGPEVFSFRQLLELTLRYSRLSAIFVPLPTPLAKLVGALAGLLPHPFLTLDQVRSLSVDNIVPAGALTLADLGIAPTPLHAVVPGYLRQYWPGGRFAY